MTAAALAALCVAGGAGLMAARDRPPVPAPQAAAALPPAAPAAEAVAAPPQVATVSPPAPAPADLPTVEVGVRAIHVVPEDGPAPPVRPVTLMTRVGRLVSTAPAAPAPAPTPQPHTLDGAARAAGGTSLTVAGQDVRLFGVRTADAPDRCAGAQGNQACGDAARDALKARLAGHDAVTCRMPAGQRGDPAFVCRDAAGVDLGRFLVADGLALADTHVSFDYVDAERGARANHSGLWRYR